MNEHCKSCVHDKGDVGFCDKCGYTYMHRKHGLPPTEYEAEPKPQTNANRIRSMTDDLRCSRILQNGAYRLCRLVEGGGIQRQLNNI